MAMCGTCGRQVRVGRHGRYPRLYPAGMTAHRKTTWDLFADHLKYHGCSAAQIVAVRRAHDHRMDTGHWPTEEENTSWPPTRQRSAPTSTATRTAPTVRRA